MKSNSLKIFALASLLLLGGCVAKFESQKSTSASEGMESEAEVPDPAPNPTPTPTSTPNPMPNPPPVPAIPVRTSPTPGQWVNVTSNLAGMASECGNMTFVTSKPTEDLMIAGVAAKGLFASSDGGANWRALGSVSPTEMITNRPSAIVFDPVYSNVFYESGIYNGRGVFRTDNNGGSFRSLGTIGHNDGLSVDFTDPNRQTLLAGGHEQKRTIHLSRDGGMTWTNVGGGMAADSAFSCYPLVINSQTFFMGSFQSWGGGVGGIYQSNNGGTTWNRVAKGGSAEPLKASDGSIYWPSDDGSLMRGVGSGANWTWTEVTRSGVLRNDVHPIELPDGRIASLSGQNIMISSDRGANWTAFGPQLPFRAVGLAYSQFDRAFYIWHFDCGNRVLPNAIMKLWM